MKLKAIYNSRFFSKGVIMLLMQLIGCKIKCIVTGKKLVVISLYEHIGDIIACEPVVPFIKVKHPNSYVVWIVRTSYISLIEAHPQLDKIIGINSFDIWILVYKILHRYHFLPANNY